MVANFTPIDPDSIGVKKNQPVVSGQFKEAEPLVSPPEKFEMKEVAEHEPDEEVKPYIAVKSQTIQLPPDLKKLGVQSMPPSVLQSYQNVKLPITDDKVLTGLHAPISSSFRWLATLALYLLKRAHLGLKVVHGKVIRVLRG